jgi:hypothetical protein
MERNLLMFPPGNGRDGRSGSALIVRLAADGRPLGGSSDLQFSQVVVDVAAYGDLVGELMGLGRFVALELTLSSQEACLVRRQPSGQLLAARAPLSDDLEALRNRLGG